MYLFKKNTFNLIKIKINFLLILSSLFFYTNSYANEKFIGFVDSLQGDAFIIKGEETIKLNEFDQIFINDKIKTDTGSSIIVSFVDNSLLTFKDKSEFSVKEFDKNSSKPLFILSITDGKFTFESGSIAKNKDGEMKVRLSGLDVKLNGTLITGENSEGEKNVSLLEDSTGNLGTLEIGIEGSNETKVISDSASGVSLTFTEEEQQALTNGDSSNLTTTLSSSEDTQLSEEEENSVVNSIKEVTVQSATKSEEKIERAIAKQLASGTIPDANGDGIADSADVEAYKAELLGLKKSKLDYVVEQSTDDLSLLSDIIVNSNSDQSMGLMENMMENNSESAALLMTEIVEQDFDIFSHVSTSQTGNFENLRETIVTEMIQDDSDFVADTMAQMMAVGNSEMGAYMMNEITNTQPVDGDQRNLAMDVLATFTEVASDKMDAYMQADPSMMSNFTQSAFQNADEGDAEMIADMMQQANGKNSAYLMSSMMENNNTMISSVYGNLAEQDFDIFNHIEKAKMAPTNSDTDPFPTPGTDPANMMSTQNDFYNDLKGQIFEEIINNSDQTAAEATAGLMMNSEGDSAMFMMETMMETNPEMIGDVMQGFVDDDFDIFDHFEDTAINEPIDTIAPEDNEINNLATNTNRKGLTKEERIAAKAERKAEKQRIKAIRKADRLIAKEERKAARKAAKLAVKNNSNEADFIPVEINSDFQDFKADVFKDMMTYSNDDTMGTMAQLVAGADEQTASLIFETVVSEQNNMMAVDGVAPKNNFALDLMSNLSSVDSGVMDKMYETQGDLVNNMMSTAMTNISSDDSGAIANIISSSGNDQMNAMVFNNIASSGDQNLTSNVFTNLADTESGSDAIMTMASTNQSLYENMAQDVDPTYMTAASLLTDTTATYNTASATDMSTTTDTDTTTFAAGAISWTTYPTSPGTLTTSSYVSISGTASSKNGVTYSASDLPDGLTFDYTTGMIFGTPTSAGIWNTTLTATDMMDFNSFATASITFDIVEDNTGGAYNDPTGGALSFMSTPYPPATLTVNNAITPIYLYTSGGTGNINYSATGLPSGLSVSITGSIIGTPDTQSFSSSSVTIIASDDDGNTASTNLTFPQVDSGGAAGGGGSGPSWSTYLYPPTTLTEGTEMMDMYLDATGTGALNFTASNLPMGLYVDGQYIKGTPSMQVGYTSSVMITATDDIGSQTKYVTFPQVNASGGGGSVTWNTLAADFSTLTLTQGSPMTSINLSATGVGVITYSDDAFLPAGISLTAGVVSGTPTSSTEFSTSVTFTATDSNGNTEDLFVSFPAINASGGGGSVTWNTLAADFSTLTLTQGSPMTSINLSATGVGVITYSDDAFLPAGISLTAGVVSGTPTSSTEFSTSVTFTATDSNGNTEDLFVSFPAINASGGGNPTFTTIAGDVTTSLGSLTQNSSITSFSIGATGGMSPISYSASGLPTGLSLSSTGVLSGTPTVPGTGATVTFTATDMNFLTDSFSLIFPTVTAAGGGISNPSWSTEPSFNASYTTSDNFSITASATSSPPANGVNYSATGLPMGVTIDSNSGLISGSTTMTGPYNVTVTAQDAMDATYQVSTASLSFTVTEGGGAETVDFTTAETLPSANAGQNINETVVATGSQGSMPTYSFISVTNTGNINGLGGTTITITGNQISGIAPRLLNAATYSFEFQASIQAGTITNNRTFKLLISEDATCVSPTNNICT
ncbi:putative Ig domain-containing protein [Candidatus Pelagibacter sp.]|nr:putative Ig domain-containing protein [Candidatus Pelagibacter sp.]